KDRIQSQILTHYPPSMELGMKITAQEARTPVDQAKRVRVPELIRVLIERIALEARSSEFVDPKSGVSARLTITALESAISAAERRALLGREERTTVRIADLLAVVPAINGKIELVYEGEQEGPEKVAQHLLGAAIKNVFLGLFPDPEKARKQAKADARGRTVPDPYAAIIGHFDTEEVDLLNVASDALYRSSLNAVPGLHELVTSRHKYLDAHEVDLWMEFVLHGLAEMSRIGRTSLEDAQRFTDVMGTVFSASDDEEEA
ncbi:MAG: magnesium chelatase, partial [Flavobacteriales bacterium]|nr:magnesium chelatase [Flavobacteriales bacterium]